MDPVVKVALITGACSIITGILSFVISLVTTSIQHNKTSAETKMEIKKDIEHLTEKVNKHNHLIEKTYALEADMQLVKEKIAVANHRIEDLENK